MQKISGILPANARVTTVDIKASGAMRGGMPTFGREVGVTAAAEKKIQLEAAAKFNLQSTGPVLDVAQFEHKNQMQLRQENADPKAAIVTNMAEKFFMNKLNQPKVEMQMSVDENSDLIPDTKKSMGKVDGISIDDNADTDEIRLGDETSSAGGVEASGKSNKLGVVDLSQLTKEPTDDEGEDTLLVGQYLDVQA